MFRSWQELAAFGGYLLLIPLGYLFDRPLIRIGCTAAVILLALAAWLINLRRLRAIRDTPTSRVGSAAQGYVELMGTGRPMPDQTVYSPINRLPCLWYRYARFERKDNNWRHLDSDQSEVPFILDDGTGRCLIDPIGANILTDTKASHEDGDYRIEEELLLYDAALYVLGEFGTRGGALSRFDERAEIGDLLEDWKQDPIELHRRFDLDRDGRVDEQEWLLARAAAQREVAARRQAILDTPPDHILFRPRNGRPYLISNHPPEKLVNRYRLKVFLHFAICLGALIVLPLAA